MRRWQERAKQIHDKSEELQLKSLPEIIVYLCRDASLRLFSIASIIWGLTIIVFLPYPFLSPFLIGILAFIYVLITFSVSGIAIWSVASWARKSVHQYWDYHSPPHKTNSLSSNWVLFQSSRSSIADCEVQPPEQLLDYSSTHFKYGIYSFISAIIPIAVIYEMGVLKEVVANLTQSEISTVAAFVSVLLGRGLGFFALSIGILLERTDNELPIVLTILISSLPVLFVAPAMRNFLEAIEVGQKKWLKDRYNPERPLLSELWALAKLVLLHIGVGFSLLFIFGVIRTEML